MHIVITKGNLIHNISFHFYQEKQPPILHFSYFLITIPNIFFWQKLPRLCSLGSHPIHTTAEKSMHILLSSYFPAKTPIYSVAWKLKFQLTRNHLQLSLAFSCHNSLKPTVAKTTEFPCFGSHHFPQHRKPLLPHTFLRNSQGWCPPEQTQHVTSKGPEAQFGARDVKEFHFRYSRTVPFLNMQRFFF